MTHRTRCMVASGLTLAVVLGASIHVSTLGATPAAGQASFGPAGSLAEARAGHTATLLADGRVLVLGGDFNGNRRASAELWDAATATFGPAGSLTTGRTSHTATSLSEGCPRCPPGRILVIGGSAGDVLAAAELWDSVTSSSLPGGALAAGRQGHTATLLPGGGVLVVGGYDDDGYIPGVERWDPVLGAFGPAGSLASPRGGHTATLLADGRVLILGGQDDDGFITTAELFDPTTGAFGAAGSLLGGRSGHTATLLPDGRVLVVGGSGDEGDLASAELFDPTTGSSSASGSLAEARIAHTATLLPDGHVLVVGGERLAEGIGLAESWDPATGSFRPAGMLIEPRTSHTSTLLPDGRVLVVGGGAFTARGFDILASAELWAPGSLGSPEDNAPGAPASPAPSGPGAVPSPAPSDDDELDAALAMVELLNMPPAGIMETCQAGTPSLDGQLAVIQCSFGADTVVYTSFDDIASLHAAYDTVATAAGPEGGTSCQEGPFEGSYPAADGTEAGHVVCQISADGSGLAWTDDRSLIMGFLLLAGDGGYPALHDHWLHVRLDAARSSGPSSSPANATAEPVGPGGEIRQWAASATASSQYLNDDWSAQQATGSPDTSEYGDRPTAWAPSKSQGGLEWLELTYTRSVVPTAVNVYESSGAGALTMIEALPDGSDSWVTLWAGTDPSPDALTTFSPPLAAIPISVGRLRLTLDTSVPGWNEIDAVELVGTLPP